MKSIARCSVLALSLALAGCTATATTDQAVEPTPSFEVIPLQHASSNVVAKTLEQLGMNGVKVLSDTRTNSLLVMAPPESMDGLHDVVAHLDVSVESASDTNHQVQADTEIIKLHYADAEEVADILHRLVRDANGGRSTGIRIEPDERTNSLIVLAEEKTLTHIKELVGRLDVKVSDG